MEHGTTTFTIPQLFNTRIFKDKILTTPGWLLRPRGQVHRQWRLTVHVHHVIRHTRTPAVPLKVMNPQNKRDYTMFTLRDLAEEHLSSPESIKDAIYAQVGENTVSSKLDFQIEITEDLDK